MKVKIGMIQSLVEFDKPEENLDRAKALVAEAVKEGAQICVLPECGDLGWGNDRAKELGHPIPGAGSDRLCAVAKEFGVYLAAGLTEVEEGHAYNAAILISDAGEILLKHRKISTLRDVEGVYDIGTSLTAVDTPFGRIAITICADNAGSSVCLGHALGRMGTQLLLSPCSWAMPPEELEAPYGATWKKPYGELSAQYGMPVIGVSNVGMVARGPWANWGVIGHSIAYDSNGECLIEMPHGVDQECYRVVEVEIRKAKY